MATRTRVSNTITTYPGKAKQTITLELPNSLRQFNRPGSVDVRGSGTLTVPNTSMPSTFGTFLSGKMGRSSSITDVTGNSSGFNNCTHNVEHWECPPYVITCETRCNAPYQVGTKVVTEFEVGASVACAILIGGSPWMGSDSDRRAECLSQMNPQVVKPAVDLSQQVGELIEGMTSILKLVDAAEKILKDLNRLDRWNSPAVRRFMGTKTLEDLSFKNWLDLGVAANLTYTLAFRPLLDAGKQLIEAGKNYRRALDRILDSVQVLHGNSIRKATDNSVTYSNDYHRYGCTRTVVSRVVCTAKVKYHSAFTEALKDAFDKAYYGLTPNAATFYELYPLSFVLDWVWNFGKFLADSLRKPISDISYTVLSTGWSRKETVRTEGWVDICAGTYGIPIKDIKPPGGLITGTASRITYKRENIPLDLTAGVVPAPKLKLPSLDKLATLLSLLYSVRTRREAFLRVARP